MIRRLKTYLYLGGHTCYYLLRRIFRPSATGGLALFRENYLPEGLHPVLPSERETLPDFSRCLSCGICNAFCDLLHDLPSARHRYPGASHLALSVSRVLPPHGVAAQYLEERRACGECTRCEEICPNGVPLHRMAAFLQRRMDAIDAIDTIDEEI